MWNISEKLCDTPYFFRRNREAGGAADRLAWRCALCYRAAEKRKFSLLVITAASSTALLQAEKFRFVFVSFPRCLSM